MQSALDIQMTRDESSGNLIYLTNWSRHEPAALKRSVLGNTDHWSKTKHKNLTLFTTNNKGDVHFYPGERNKHEIPPRAESLRIKPHFVVDSEMKHIGHVSFTELLLKHIGDKQKPGSYYRTRPSPKRIPRSDYYERARDGFEYWYKEKKEPFKKGWIGSSGNVLGTSCK